MWYFRLTCNETIIMRKFWALTNSNNSNDSVINKSNKRSNNNNNKYKEYTSRLFQYFEAAINVGPSFNYD